MKLIEKFQNFIIDLDGVIYIQDEPIHKAKEFIDELKKRDKDFIFLTNNSGRNSEGYRKKLEKMNIIVENDKIITSSTATAKYLYENYNIEGKKAYVIGARALKDEIRKIGLNLIEGEDAHLADFVIVGKDPDFNYEMMKIANFAIRNGAIFIATNYDATFPTPEGEIPGAGAIVSSIETVSEVKAKVIGKPNIYIMEIAISKFNGNKEQTLIIGDRLETDILAGKIIGISTALVLTGVVNGEEVSKSEIKPDWILDGIWSFLKE